MWILGDVILIITQSLKSKIFWEVLGDVSQQKPQYGPCWETTRIKLHVPRVSVGSNRTEERNDEF